MSMAQVERGATILARTASPLRSATARSIMLAIQIEANRADLAVLFAAQQISGAAQFQIERGNAEARAQIAEFFQSREAMPRQRGQVIRRGRHQQVGIGALIRSPHSPAQLIQLGESEAIGAIDDDRIGAREYPGRFR